VAEGVSHVAVSGSEKEGPQALRRATNIMALRKT
jgi:hypothetical protein